MDNAVAMTGVRPKSKVTGFTLKMIALITMFIDHLSAVLLQPYYADVMASIPTNEAREAWRAAHPLWTYGTIALRVIGRFAFPIFVFLLVEGFIHTRSKKNYALNLGIFALISEIPFNLAHGKIFDLSTQNVYFTLLLGLLCLWAIEEFGFKRKLSDKMSKLILPTSIVLGAFMGIIALNDGLAELISYFVELPFYTYIIAGAVISFLVALIVSRKWDADKKNKFVVIAGLFVAFGGVAELLHTDYSGLGVATILVMYLFKEKKNKRFALGCLVLSVFNFIEAAAFFMLIPVALYNGQRGPKVNKYFFYAFYPVHLLILYFIAKIIGIVNFGG
ncbi:MAG: conjugal transfer protein TraX [Pseudobutyrivibrio sp.]|nr:conjugal transfer protein TraX [Pseudobutyrivibrio sp.]